MIGKVLVLICYLAVCTSGYRLTEFWLFVLLDRRYLIG